MRFRSFPFLCATFALFSVARCQIPVSRSQNCGSIISIVIAVCSHPTLSRPDWCCNELKRWNDARCWCEPNAFNALDTVAANGYSFSFRDGFCAEPFQRLALGSVDPAHATCEPFGSVADSDYMERCANISPSQLRLQRLRSLDSLKDDRVQNDADLVPWLARMDSLLTEDVTLDVVGLYLGVGRFEVKQYLMTRQSQYGFQPFTADFTADHFWRNPRMVSYTGGGATNLGFFNKREFVTFEECSSRIAAIYVVEDNYQARYGQFWNAEESRLMLRYNQNAESWCADVSARCMGENFPFASVEDCRGYYNELSSTGRVTCNKFEQAFIPQYAMHGDTIACRSFYLDLAVADEKTACPAVGREPNQSRCGAPQCPGNAYIHPFNREVSVPQYDPVPEFKCGRTKCDEMWPSESQVMSIPAEDRDRFGAAASADPPTSTPDSGRTAEADAGFVPPTTATALDAATIEADADEDMDVEFENQNFGPAPPPADARGSFSAGSLNV